jgi:putative glutamine amidotransferase
VQDIPSLVPGAVGHDETRHPVRLQEDSLIARLAGTCEMEVNSFHHQCVQAAGRNLRPVAHAPDGVIEAVEDTGGRFFIGVQWHPERDCKENPVSQRLFAALIEAAQTARA